MQDEFLKSLLQDVHIFLTDTLGRENLSQIASDLRDHLLQKVKSVLRDVGAQSYADMTPAVNNDGHNSTDEQLYESYDEDSDEHYENNTPTDTPVGDDAPKTIRNMPKSFVFVPFRETLSQCKRSLSSSTSDALPNHENIPTAWMITHSGGKCGPLERRTNSRFFPFRKIWAGIKDNYMYIFARDNDSTPRFAIDLSEYEVRTCPDVIKNQRKREVAFEILCPGRKSFWFLARTKKDMEQWASAIENVQRQEEQSDDSKVLSAAEGRKHHMNSSFSYKKELAEPLVYDDAAIMEEPMYTDVGTESTTASEKPCYSSEGYTDDSDIYKEIADDVFPEEQESLMRRRATDAPPSLPPKKPVIKRKSTEDEDLYDDVKMLREEYDEGIYDDAENCALMNNYDIPPPTKALRDSTTTKNRTQQLIKQMQNRLFTSASVNQKMTGYGAKKFMVLPPVVPNKPGVTTPSKPMKKKPPAASPPLPHQTRFTLPPTLPPRNACSSENILSADDDCDEIYEPVD